MQFYIKQNYYFDIDERNQLRICGPENHLFLGMTFPPTLPVSINHFGIYRGELIITIDIATDSLRVPIPLVSDIRTLRGITEPLHPRPTYRELVEGNEERVLPQKIEQFHKA